MYEWLKALHIISMISWMVGLLYLPRLFVYHTNSEVGSPESETFKIMERKLSLYIMTPAMLATWVFGLWLLMLAPEWLSEGWMHVKLVAVLGLSAFHMVAAGWRRALFNDARTRSARFFRIANEAPTVLLIAVVILVVVKPF